jgi:hypothetical protein
MYVASNYKLNCPKCGLEMMLSRGWKFASFLAVQGGLFLMVAFSDRLNLSKAVFWCALVSIVAVHLLMCATLSLKQNPKLRSPKWPEK